MCVDHASDAEEDAPQLIFTTDDLAEMRQQLTGHGYSPVGEARSDAYFIMRDPDATLVVCEWR